jgi:hypothetical protein
MVPCRVLASGTESLKAFAKSSRYGIATTAVSGLCPVAHLGAVLQRFIGRPHPPIAMANLFSRGDDGAELTAAEKAFLG